MDRSVSKVTIAIALMRSLDRRGTTNDVVIPLSGVYRRRLPPKRWECAHRSFAETMPHLTDVTLREM